MSILQNKSPRVNQIRRISEFKILAVCLLYSFASPLLALNQSQLWQAEALRLHLSQHKDWINLLHGEKTIWGKLESQVDDEAFFLSPQGKQDLQAELLADIAAFVENDQLPAAQCRFPARFYWLQQQLKHLGEITQTSCEKFIDWKNKIHANRVSLVFPSMYINNPVSMFGHTFLRLDQNKQSSLLSYTLSYTARINKTDGFFTYAYKGISGGYAGYFTTRPYYQTLAEYGDIEHRDIWEYDLDLNQQEIDQMIRHLWELSGMNFDYFFLRENCAYRLLAILDVARPGVNLLDNNAFPIYAIPVDTVRRLVEAEIVTDRHYRPAISSRLQQMYQQLDSQSQSQALQLAADEITIQSLQKQHTDVLQQARILRLASELKQFKQEDNHDILFARSQLTLPPATDLFHFSDVDPQTSHASARWGLGAGMEQNSAFSELSIRPALHDLLDRPEGFLNGVAISGLQLSTRWFPAQKIFRLQQFEIFSMSSLSPVTEWSMPVSIKIKAAFQRYLIGNNSTNSITPFSLDASLGYSKKYASLMIYGMAAMALDYSARLEKNAAIYTGAEFGALLQLRSSRLLVNGKYLYAVMGEENRRLATQLSYQYDFSPDHSIRIEWQIDQYLQFASRTASVNYLQYF